MLEKRKSDNFCQLYSQSIKAIEFVKKNQKQQYKLYKYTFEFV